MSKACFSSKAKSPICAESWDQSSPSFSLGQASFPSATMTSTTAKFRQDSKVSIGQPHIQTEASCPQTFSTIDPSSENVRPFDAFVDVPSPFAKLKIVAKSHDYPHLDQTQKLDTTIAIPHLNHTSLSSPSPNNLAIDVDLAPDTELESDTTMQGRVGYLDARTRAVNLQHIKPEWTTWDFVDLYLSKLPPGIKTVDLWNNFKKEGEVDLVEIFVTRGGQKDTRGKVRFRQVLHSFFLSFLWLIHGQTTTAEGLLHDFLHIYPHSGEWSVMADQCST